MNIQNLLKDPRTNWKYLLIVVVLAFLAGGGILIYQYWWLPKTEIPASTLIFDKTANWKTYRNVYSYKNDYCGYEIKYPPNWPMEEFKGVYEAKWRSPRVMVLPLIEIFIETRCFQHRTEGNIETISCTAMIDPKFPGLKYGRIPIGKEKIGETEFCEIKISESDETGKIGVLGFKYITVKDDFDYINTLWIVGGAPKDYPSEDNFQYELTTFRQMLSTLRFIERDETAN